jgi:hypothetical protein
LSHVIHRLKEDKIVYDLRKYNAARDLEFVKKQLNFNKLDATSVTESKDRTKSVYERLVKKL